jgi:hypothetical protein
MTDQIENSHGPRSGGCQCIEGEIGNPSVCHCRMCQKAFGGFYAPLVMVGGTLTWTRGTLKHFQSSNFVSRGFCGDCGTPLTYEAPGGVAVAIAAFDHPESITPVIQYGGESKLPYVDAIPALPQKDTLAESDSAPFLAQIVSYQHPDHDTDVWPPQ